ncbi:K(+) efflux antiporter [Saliniradius amylolyticus]|uniref:K(+) efflux antiporter n=1 Tax=Saliniradius amylolyticus TaxID=2183582 RepID=A0A2S2E3T9_9ALTE|nr:cation:proton antiporter [Saliniradius amylolyticus]AWL12259.1 K(+) efflux antiporter [Saliniradius amylolyticus]
MLELIHSHPFYELTTLLVMAALIGLVCLLLRQPMIVGFIAVGILAGPGVFDVVQNQQSIQLLAELAIAVLLFLVGLKLDIKLFKTLGTVSLATGLGQVIFTSVIGMAICLALGMDWVTSAYVAVALTFSSTIIIVKLLSDKKEVDSLHGQIAIGFLIVQDLVVVFAMISLSAMGQSATEDLHPLLRVAVSGIGLVLAVLLFSRYLAKPILHQVAKVPELLLVFSIGLAALLASLGDTLGLSKELGGLLAGIALASTPYRESIISRLSSLRDFLLLFFFMALGTQLDLSLLGEQMGAALVLSLFVLVGNPLIVVIIMGYMGFRRRTGFLAGLTVAQISEFSLIFVAMGISLGHLNQSTLGLVTLVGLITIALSVYMITYSHSLYDKLAALLKPFERQHPFREEAYEADPVHYNRHYDVVVYGLGRFGSELAESLLNTGLTIAVVDFNPDIIQRWRNRQVDAFYGDATDPALLDYLPVLGARWIISTLPGSAHQLGHNDPRIALIQALKHHQYSGKIAVTSYHSTEKDKLWAEGADEVVMPFSVGAEHIANWLKQPNRKD